MTTQRARRRSLFRALAAAPILRRRLAEAAAEAAVEIADFVEAAGKRDIADPESIVPWDRQHGARLLQAQLQHAIGEARAGFAHQLLHVTWRQAELERHLVRRER